MTGMDSEGGAGDGTYNRAMIAGDWRSVPIWSSAWPAVGLAVALGVAIGGVAGEGSPLGAAALLFGVALAVVVLREPRAGLHALAGLVFLLPFAVVPVRLGAQLTALEALLGLTGGAIVLRALAHRERPRASGPGWLMLAFLALAGLAFVLGLPHSGALGEVGRRFFKLILAMLVFFAVLRVVRSGAEVDRLVLGLMLFGAAEGLLAVGLQFAPRDLTVGALSTLGPLGYPTGQEVLRFLPGENDTYTDIARATGTSVDPNVLGGALMLAAALQVSQLFAPRPLLPRWLLAPAAGVTVLAMLLSHSRSSWVGLAGGLLVLATLRYRRLWLGLGPAALAVAAVPAGRALYERVLLGFAGQDKAAGMRRDEYRNAFEIIKQHPWFGIGFGGPPAIDLAPGVSSIYLTVGETAGVPALLVYVALFGCLVVPAVRALLGPLEPRLQGALAGLLTALVAGLVAGLFDHYFASTVFPHMVALFWLIGALVWRATGLAGEGTTKLGARPGGPSVPTHSVTVQSS